MLVRSLILLAILSSACGPEPVKLGDMWACSYMTPGGAGWLHSIWQYTDGSAFSTCQIVDGRDTITSVSMYRGDQPGAASAMCSVVADWDTVPTNGFWRFTFNGSTSSSVIYQDPGSSFHGMTQNLSCTKY